MSDLTPLTRQALAGLDGAPLRLHASTTERLLDALDATDDDTLQREAYALACLVKWLVDASELGAASQIADVASTAAPRLAARNRAADASRAETQRSTHRRLGFSTPTRSAPRFGAATQAGSLSAHALVATVPRKLS
ncbi:MAG: hypothetical protein RIT81_06160 [Deltaproteobacteria bacterium]